VPLAQFVKYAVAGRPGDRPRWLRCLGVVAAGGVLLVLVVTQVPWPLAQRAPALVQYEPWP